MKKIMKKLTKLILMVFTSLFLFIGCEVEEPTPQCELENYGSVTVKNDTGYSLYVDVTWGTIWENYVKRLSNGSSHKYNEIPAGQVEIWASFNNSDWSYEVKHLSSCEDITFRWYDSSKSANLESPNMLNVTLEISRNGEVIEIITDLKRKTKFKE